MIRSLHIRNFRNYDDVSLNLENGIHFLVGKNGQGKTNLLESIYYLSCTKSHRTNDTKKLIKQDKPFFLLSCLLDQNNRKTEVKCVVNENGKNLFLYQNPVKKVSDFIGHVNAVLFCPQDMFLFEGSPKERRRFIDLELGKLSRSYTNTLNEYYQLLKERNAYLKQDKIDVSFLEILNTQLIEKQVVIIRQRKKFVDDMIKNSASFYKELSDDDTLIGCKYLSFVEYDEEEKMKEKMKEKYAKSLERDKLYKQTHMGIHKDDFIFTLNENEIVSFASQGQKRSVLLALKLGIVETIFLLTHAYPILLLDDVFSELDKERRNRLLHLLNDDMQIVITSTDVIPVQSHKRVQYYLVEDGKIQIMKEESTL